MPAVCTLMVHQEQIVQMTIYAIGLNLLTTHTEGGGKLSHQTRLLRYGNLPDAEETQHVIYTIGIEILRHLAEAAHPPRAVVLEHLVPVVGGEAPVLSVVREGIGWCSSLSVEVEVTRLYPGLHTIATDADGDITLQYHLILTCILVGSTHLLVEDILDEIPEVEHLSISLRQALGPLREGGGTVFISIEAEAGIGLQPLAVVIDELLIGSTTFDGGTLLLEDSLQITHLGLHHAFIVYLWQGIQFLAQRFVLRFQSLILQGWQLTQIGILRMQGIDADRVVGIRVLPGMSDSSIVDRQYLQHVLTRLGTPVYNHPQVAEVSYAEAPLTTQREDGNHSTSTLPQRDTEPRLLHLDDHHLANLHIGFHQYAILAILPDNRVVA